MKKTAFIFLCLAMLPSAAFCGADTDMVLKAMRAELDRSFRVFSSTGAAPAYFMQYEVSDISRYQVSAKLGALDKESDSFRRYLDTDIRVGSARLDNTHEIKGEVSSRKTAPVFIPLENDADALRAAIWRDSDRTFKDAQARFTKVATNMVTSSVEENPAPDFSAAAPAVYYEETRRPDFDRDYWRAFVRRLSDRFRGYTFIYDSVVTFSALSDDRRVVSSEGTTLRSGTAEVSLAYYIHSKTDDGMVQTRGRHYYAETADRLPSEAALLADMEKSIAELKALKEASLIQPYSGPVILKNRAAAVYFHEIFGHRVEGHRQKLQSSGQTFAKKLGVEVMSDIISIYDDPTQRYFNGAFMHGSYKYDDEGVPARRVNVVENGVLKNFLMGRSPLADEQESNGHSRRQPGLNFVPRQGNFIVTASKPVPYAELRRKLISECRRQGKPYGLVLDDISGGFTTTNTSGPQAFTVKPLLVYKVYVDGRPDEVVRGVNIVGTPLTSFSKIMAAADDGDVFNGICGAESGSVPVSNVAPSVLISEMEVEKVAKDKDKAPLLLPPQEAGQ